MTLRFTYEEVKNEFKKFVNEFLSDEQGVVKTELLPNYYSVEVPAVNFKANIKLAVTEDNYGNEEYLAIVEDLESKTKDRFLLFKKEKENWLAEQRKIRGKI